VSDNSTPDRSVATQQVRGMGKVLGSTLVVLGTGGSAAGVLVSLLFPLSRILTPAANSPKNMKSALQNGAILGLLILLVSLALLAGGNVILGL